ncbi:transcription repressor NadR [Lacticaseibacillus sp. N501-2]|uniref:transcription repressor NadR n=1 Tax=Lacticaseibacillus salsurae TaxID=3367729 RepID=UPI0038B3E1A4
MLTSAERQSQIQMALADAKAPITATAFAKKFGVSRQTVVGDVALLRAQGTKLIATPRGYQFEDSATKTAVIVCKHSPEDAVKEMQIIIDHGGVVKDVMIDHPVYGQLRGSLEVASEQEIHLFHSRMLQHESHMLSELTDGVHLHTIGYEKPEQISEIKQALREAGFLYE